MLPFQEDAQSVLRFRSSLTISHQPLTRWGYSGVLCLHRQSQGCVSTLQLSLFAQIFLPLLPAWASPIICSRSPLREHTQYLHGPSLVLVGPSRG